jgi:hypothetical protein
MSARLSQGSWAAYFPHVFNACAYCATAVVAEKGSIYGGYSAITLLNRSRYTSNYSWNVDRLCAKAFSSKNTARQVLL